MPSTSAPRAPSRPVRGGVGHRAAAGLAAGGGDQLRRTPGGAGGRVGLVGVVQLDDLDRLVERRGLGGEAHHQHRADGEVGGDQHAGARARRRASRAASSSRSSSKPVVPTTAWMPCAMQNSQVVHHHVGVGEVDDRLGAGVDQRPASVVVGVDARRPARGRRPPRPRRHTSRPTLPRAPSTPTLRVTRSG